MEKCHICGNETDLECQQCGEFVCENCTMTYNQFTQIDYTLCKICGGEQEQEKADEYIKQDQEEKRKLIEKQIRNEKQRAYYHSEKAIEKRRLKKIEKIKKEQEYREERAKVIANIFKDMFRHM
jgi:hypothetical protein